MKTQELETTARARVAAGKGDLAADKSVPTIEKRFKSINVPSTEESRQAYRELLFATPLAGAGPDVRISRRQRNSKPSAKGGDTRA